MPPSNTDDVPAGDPASQAPQDPAGGDPTGQAAGHESAEPVADPAAEVPTDAAAGAPDPAEPDAASAAGEPVPELTVETLIADLERVTAERDQYQRVAAEFSNFRKQTEKRQQELASFAAAGAVERLLPVLDACDGALAQGATDVAPIHTLLLDTLVSLGLARLGEPGDAFDPNLHEAVMTEPAAEGDDGQVVTEVLRSGYGLNGRTLRAAMVKVRG